MRFKTREILEDRLFTAGEAVEEYADEPEALAEYAEIVAAIEAALESGKLCKVCEQVLSEYAGRHGWIETASHKRQILQDLAESGLLEEWSPTAVPRPRKFPHAGKVWANEWRW